MYRKMTGMVTTKSGYVAEKRKVSETGEEVH